MVKGQAWNVVQSLRHHDEGPLELARRQKVLVWDDEVEVADETMQEIINGPLSASPKPSVRTLPVQPASHRRTRSSGILEARGFPPPSHRSPSDSRPVPFLTTLPRVHPGTTGVTILEHMERVDAVEAGLRRLQTDDNVILEEDEEEEVDVGVPAASSSRPPTIRGTDAEREGSATPTAGPSPPMSPETTQQDLLVPAGADSLASSMTEEDLVAMSQSTSALDFGRQSLHSKFMSQEGTSTATRPNLDWIREEEVVEERKRIVIEEVCFFNYIGLVG